MAARIVKAGDEQRRVDEQRAQRPRRVEGEHLPRDELQEVARTYFKSETVALGALGNLNGFNVDRSRLSI